MEKTIWRVYIRGYCRSLCMETEEYPEINCFGIGGDKKWKIKPNREEE